MSECKAEKAAMRASIAERLAILSPEERIAQSVGVCSQLMKLRAYREARGIMLYAPFGVEVDIGTVALAAFREGRDVFVPEFDVPGRSMWPVEVASWDIDRWPKGRLGVPQAPSREPAEPARIDLVVVPGLAFDSQQRRLGRGMGFYDRFLRDPRLGATTVGAAFREQIVDSVPCESFDSKLDAVVTCDGVLTVA